MQAHIDGDEMPPRGEPAVPPGAKDSGAEGKGAGLQEGEEAAAEASAVDVHEVAVAPVVLEVGWWHKGEFAVLVGAVIVPSASDAVDNGDVEREVEGCEGCGEVLVGVFSL